MTNRTRARSRTRSAIGWTAWSVVLVLSTAVTYTLLVLGGH